MNKREITAEVRRNNIVNRNNQNVLAQFLHNLLNSDISLSDNIAVTLFGNSSFD